MCCGASIDCRKVRKWHTPSALNRGRGDSFRWICLEYASVPSEPTRSCAKFHSLRGFTKPRLYPCTLRSTFGQPARVRPGLLGAPERPELRDRKSPSLNSSYRPISHAVLCLDNKNK